jgi:hypothetical protein
MNEKFWELTYYISIDIKTIFLALSIEENLGLGIVKDLIH